MSPQQTILVKDIADILEISAPLPLQEAFDNAGLQVGRYDASVTSVLICLDVTEVVVDEAIEKKCDLIISHHPLLFKGVKKLTGKNDVERCIIKAIRNDIAIYSAHTNIDNVLHGVNGRIAEKIGLKNTRVLEPKEDILLKLVTFAPNEFAEKIREAMFQAGAGHIGNYDSCSYNLEGTGTFRANEGAQPFTGKIGQLHFENEIRIEVVLPDFLKNKVVSALLRQHPYEEPAYDIFPLKNSWAKVGSGIIGELEEPEDEIEFLQRLKTIFGTPTVRHTNLLGRKIQKVALCGGAGSSFLSTAISLGADVYVSGDFKYHDFFQAENNILVADIGHYESEQFTKDVFYEIITKKIPNFAVRISGIKTNPINYL